MIVYRVSFKVLTCLLKQVLADFIKEYFKHQHNSRSYVLNYALANVYSYWQLICFHSLNQVFKQRMCQYTMHVTMAFSVMLKLEKAHIFKLFHVLLSLFVLVSLRILDAFNSFKLAENWSALHQVTTTELYKWK